MSLWARLHAYKSRCISVAYEPFLGYPRTSMCSAVALDLERFAKSPGGSTNTVGWGSEID